jgi:hypothetical protein
MSRKEAFWCCRVTLFREADENGNPLQTPEKIEFGPDIYDENHVTDRILRAQLAILHRHHIQELLDASASELETLKERLSQMRAPEFSSDSIRVDIEGQEIQDLSFVDLPGTAPFHFPRMTY